MLRVCVWLRKVRGKWLWFLWRIIKESCLTWNSFIRWMICRFQLVKRSIVQNKRKRKNKMKFFLRHKIKKRLYFTKNKIARVRYHYELSKKSQCRAQPRLAWVTGTPHRKMWNSLQMKVSTQLSLVVVRVLKLKNKIKSRFNPTRTIRLLAR